MQDHRTGEDPTKKDITELVVKQTGRAKRRLKAQRAETDRPAGKGKASKILRRQR